MAYLRPIAFLLIFFGLLFAFRVPVSNTGSNIRGAVLNPMYSFLQSLIDAHSSLDGYSALPTGNDGPRGLNASTTSSSATVRASSTAMAQKPSVNNLPPVKSNIATHQDSALTVAGIIKLTNAERTSRGLPALTHNETLDTSASAKVDDMFANQYFEHVSPSGKSVSDVVTKAGYSYIVVGENLALGNFGGDANVVAAWMASPGHRANILDSRYMEIGVAVGRGMYQGREQWLAVQHFGKPLSSCPTVDSQLKSSIQSTKNALTERENQITALKAQIDAMSPSDPRYNELVATYNDDVKEYNARLDAFKAAVDQYNESVKAFNRCAGLTTT